MMDTEEIVGLRLLHQQISAPQADKNTSTATAEAVVSHLGAVQAQDYPGALWSIALRTGGLIKRDIEAAVEESRLVRTWLMRGTLHIVSAADIRWMLDLHADRMIAQSAQSHRKLELDDALLLKARKILEGALRDTEQLTRAQIFDILKTEGIETGAMRGVFILRHLSMTQFLCSGAWEDKSPTFSLFERRIPAAKPRPREESLAELAARYFCGHGPATRHDFARWAGLTMGDARLGIRAAAPQLLQRAGADGEEYWMSKDQASLKGASNPQRPDAHVASLLSGFDEYMLGYKDRSAALEPCHSHKICPGKNGVFFPTVLLNGRVAGTWKAAKKSAQIDIKLTPFDTFDPTDIHAIKHALTRYAAYLGTPVALANS